MHFLSVIFSKNKRESRRLFNQANAHWKRVKGAVISGSEQEALAPLLEVVRYCQQSISFDQQRGDAYVLLTNALLRAGQISPHVDRDVLKDFAAGVIYSWRDLPNGPQRGSSHATYDIGMRLLAEVDKRAGDRAQALLHEYGGLLTTPEGFVVVAQALEFESDQEAGTPRFNSLSKDLNSVLEDLTTRIKRAMAELALEGSDSEYSRHAQEIHRLCELQADALVDTINDFAPDSPLSTPAIEALSALTWAIGQGEVGLGRQSSDLPGVPEAVQRSWHNLWRAASHDEAGALARAHEVYRSIMLDKSV